MISNVLWCLGALGLVLSTMPIVEKYYLMLTFSLSLPFFVISTHSFNKVKKHELWAFLFILVATFNYPVLMMSESLLASTTMLICFVLLFCCERASYLRHHFVIFNRLMLFLLLYIFIEHLVQLLIGTSLLFNYGLMFGHKSTGPFPNTYADTLSIVFIFYFFFVGYGTSLIGISKVSANVILCICIVILFISGSRAAILVLFSTVLVGYFVVYDVSKAIKRFTASTFVIALIFFVFYVFFSDNEFFHRFFYKIDNLLDLLSNGLVIDDINSTTIRLLIWNDLISVWLEQPLYLFFGYGFGTLPFANAEVFQKPFLNVADAQNVWLDLLYSVGIFGLVFFTMFTLYLYRHLTRSVNAKLAKVVIFCLVFWPINPFSVQHKLEAAWYFMQISFSWILASYISKFHRGKVS